MAMGIRQGEVRCTLPNLKAGARHPRSQVALRLGHDGPIRRRDLWSTGRRTLGVEAFLRLGITRNRIVCQSGYRRGNDRANDPSR